MMCYRDRTYCPFYGECKKGETCGRALTGKVKEDAVKWWGGEDAPICTYTDKPDCFDKKEEINGRN